MRSDKQRAVRRFSEPKFHRTDFQKHSHTVQCQNPYVYFRLYFGIDPVQTNSKEYCFFELKAVAKRMFTVCVFVLAGGVAICEFETVSNRPEFFILGCVFYALTANLLSRSTRTGGSSKTTQRSA